MPSTVNALDCIRFACLICKKVRIFLCEIRAFCLSVGSDKCSNLRARAKANTHRIHLENHRTRATTKMNQVRTGLAHPHQESAASAQRPRSAGGKPADHPIREAPHQRSGQDQPGANRLAHPHQGSAASAQRPRSARGEPFGPSPSEKAPHQRSGQNQPGQTDWRTPIREARTGAAAKIGRGQTGLTHPHQGKRRLAAIGRQRKTVLTLFEKSQRRRPNPINPRCAPPVGHR